MMKKGFSGKVNDTCFKVLDNRKNGAETNIEIEVTDNENRGIAVLKLYGPNKRKGNVVMVTKSKQSDAKFVTILAKNVVLPLIKQFLTGEKDDERTPGPKNPSVSVRGKELKILKCPHCEKNLIFCTWTKGTCDKDAQ
jgi:hypothetical protein